MVFEMFLILDNNDDKEKFCFLYKKINATIYKRVYSILKNEHDTEDALQETWVKVMKNFHKIKDQSYEKEIGFIWMVAKNTAIDIYNKRKRTVDIDDLDSMLSERTESVENNVISKIETDKMLTTVKNINEKYKKPLMLKLLYGFTNKEIAEILNITETNVSTRISRAKESVRKIILKRDENDE